RFKLRLENDGRGLVDFPAELLQPVAQLMMKRLGHRGMTIMRIQDCLTSLKRLSLFMERHLERIAPHENDRAPITALGADIRALSDFAIALDAKIEFLLNAMIGLIALNQNKITLVLSLTAAMFLPATLISSIFGMNFVDMPGLTWHHGFFICVGVMVAAAIFVGVIFRWRRWM
ncbi:MAG: CorA family divalent cation transporter, partial [Pseudomonadota bacterium]